MTGNNAEIIFAMGAGCCLKVTFDCPWDEVMCCCKSKIVLMMYSGKRYAMRAPLHGRDDIDRLEEALTRALAGALDYVDTEVLSLGYWWNKLIHDDLPEGGGWEHPLYDKIATRIAIERGCRSALFLYSQGEQFFWEFSPTYSAMFSAKEDDEGNYPAFCEFMKSYKPYCTIPTDRDTLHHVLQEVKQLLDIITANTTAHFSIAESSSL